MKVLVTGAKGQLGSDCAAELSARGHEVIASDLPELDITDGGAVSRFIGEVRPDAVIHCAAWTAVDAAESNAEKVFLVNAKGTENIARVCGALGCKLLYISTDYVFSGEGSEPWRPDCTEFSPCNVYGRSKLEGEFAVKAFAERYFIVRIAWVFGKHGNNFVKTMLSLSRRAELRVVNDQIGTPTYTPDLSRLLADMIGTEKYGVYHATNGGGYISWYDFAREIFRRAGLQTKVVPVTTEEYGLSAAKRPFNSRLDKSKLAENGFAPLPDWRDALQRYLKDTEDIWRSE